jgi:hypothetical protein
MTADVGGAFLALGGEDRLAAEEGQVGAEGAVLHDVVGHGQAVLAAEQVVVVAVGGGGVHEAGAGLVGDVVAGEHGDVVVPFALRAVEAAEGVGEGQGAELVGRDAAAAAPHVGGELGLGQHAFGEASASR